jgi:uncharacterized membrane protein YjfL (UPF0719 family)
MALWLILLALGILKVLISLVFSVAAVYFAIRFFDWLTKGIDEWKEIAKGNVAVAIYLAAFVFTVSLILEPGLSKLTTDISSFFSNGFALNILIWFTFDLLSLILTIIISSLVLYVAIHLIDYLSHGMKKFEQLKKGNVAVAIILAAILIAVGLVIRQGVSVLVELTDPFRFIIRIE